MVDRAGTRRKVATGGDPMTTGTDVSRLAEALAAARRNGVPLDPLSWQAAVPDAGAAYAVQHAVAESLGWFGGVSPRFWKSGGPSQAQPLTHAPLPPVGVRVSPADCRDMSFHAPLIEIEVALKIAREMPAETAAGLAAAARDGDQAARARLGEQIADEWVEALCVSIEIVDSRWTDPGQASAPQKLADLQSHGALVLGDWIPWSRRDWSAQCCEVRIGAQPPVSRTGTHPLGSPTWLLPVWLGHVTRNGQSVPRGAIVTTGAWAGMLPAQAGDAVLASFDGIGSATVRL